MVEPSIVLHIIWWCCIICSRTCPPHTYVVNAIHTCTYNANRSSAQQYVTPHMFGCVCARGEAHTHTHTRYITYICRFCAKRTEAARDEAVGGGNGVDRSQFLYRSVTGRRLMWRELKEHTLANGSVTPTGCPSSPNHPAGIVIRPIVSRLWWNSLSAYSAIFTPFSRADRNVIIATSFFLWVFHCTYFIPNKIKFCVNTNIKHSSTKLTHSFCEIRINGDLCCL